jgi:hypothetical protein
LVNREPNSDKFALPLSENLLQTQGDLGWENCNDPSKSQARLVVTARPRFQEQLRSLPTVSIHHVYSLAGCETVGFLSIYKKQDSPYIGGQGHPLPETHLHLRPALCIGGSRGKKSGRHIQSNNEKQDENMISFPKPPTPPLSSA